MTAVDIHTEMKRFILYNLLFLFQITSARRVIGWYNGIPDFRNEVFPWDMYTHIRYGGPVVTKAGYASCNHTEMDAFVEEAHAHNVSVLWAPNIAADFVRDHSIPRAYFHTIGAAVKECNIDGIEVDYEFSDAPLGVVSHEASNAYSHFLATLQRTIQKPVGACVSLPGLAPGNWLLGWLPWVNATMLNRGDIAWVSTMSYHWNPEGDIFAWKKDVWVLLDVWGIHPERINLGVPLFSKEWREGKLVGEPSWASLSTHCPNVDPSVNVCNATVFVGKNMMTLIGELARRRHLGGLFPWELSYDSYEANNTLVPFLLKGFM